MPPALINKPFLSPHLYPIWQAFGMLASSRNVGMVPGAIPYSEIAAYYRDFGDVLPYTLREFVRLIMDIDQEYLSILDSRSKKK